MKMSTFGPVVKTKNGVTLAAKQALTELGTEPKLVIIFTPIDADQSEIISGIRAVTDVPIMGATSGGAAFTEKGITTKEVVGAFLGGESLTVNCQPVLNIKGRIKEAVMDAVSKITPQKHMGHAIFVLSDAFAGDGETFIKEIKNAVPIHWPIFGGYAGDNWQFKSSMVICNDKVYENGAVIAYINDMSIPAIGVRHGFEKVEGSDELKITNVEGNVVRTINDLPAAAVYREQLEKLNLLKKGESLIQSAANYPMGIKILWGEHLKIRTPMNVGETEVSFAGSIPKGSRVSVVYSNPDKMIDAARNMMKDTVGILKGRQPSAQIVIDCAGRWKTLAQRYPEQVEAFKSESKCPMIGFASYGEIAKYSGSLEGFHNTTSVTAIW